MEFKDRIGREIALEEKEGTIFAYDHSKETIKEAGYIQFRIQEGIDERSIIAYPEQMHIKPDYQRAGIGTNIIKYAQTLYDNVVFAEDTGLGGKDDEIHYTSEGKMFKDFFVIKSFLSAQFRKIVMKIILNKSRAPSGGAFLMQKNRR